MGRWWIVVVSVWFASSAVAEEAEVDSRSVRHQSNVTLAGHFEAIGFPFTFHRGLSAEYISHADWTFGIDYSEASLSLGAFGVDLASAKERIRTVNARFYPGTNSFHIPFGVGRRDVSVQLGDDLLSKVSGRTSHLDVVSVQQNVVHAGLANRWFWQNGFTVGVDWLDIYVPIGDSKVDAPFLKASGGRSAKKDVESMLRVLEYVPDISALRLQVGYSF